MKRRTIILLLVASVILMIVLFTIDLFSGSVWISPWEEKTAVQMQILSSIRLPKALTAILAGAGLSVAGLLMQTLFRNPLAGPYVLGISSGAGLGVALVTMCAGFFSSSLLMSSWSLAVAALLGAASVMALVLSLSHRIRSTVSLLIVGMMLGSMAGALINLIQNFANPDAIKLFVVWTFGSLNSVGWSEWGILALLCTVGLLLAVCAIKPLNGLLLGDEYAESMGIRVARVRRCIVWASCLLAGGITAFCGPIAFVGVAIPHLARGLFATSNHRLTLPASALLGANLLLICDIICSLFRYPLPISTVSALFGAPIIIYVIMNNKNNN